MNVYIEPTLEVTEVQATPIAFIRGSATTSPETIGPALGEAYGKLMAAVQAQELEMTGAPLAVHELYDRENDVYNFLAALPLASTENVTFEGGIEIGETYTGAVIQATHKGSYDGLSKTYDKIEAYLAENGHTANGSPWEQYITDPTTVAPEDIITMIYWPITSDIASGEDEVATPE